VGFVSVGQPAKDEARQDAFAEYVLPEIEVRLHPEEA
jgi:hypothetical protein